MPNRLPSLADWRVRILLNEQWLHSSPDTPLHRYDTTWETVITLKINQPQQATKPTCWGLQSASSLPTRLKTQWDVLIRSVWQLGRWVFLNRPSTFCLETQHIHLHSSNVVAIHAGYNCLQANICESCILTAISMLHHPSLLHDYFNYCIGVFSELQ